MLRHFTQHFTRAQQPENVAARQVTVPSLLYRRIKEGQMGTQFLGDIVLSLAGVTGTIVALTKLVPALVQLVRACRDFCVALPSARRRRTRARTLRNRRAARRATSRLTSARVASAHGAATRVASASRRTSTVVGGDDRLDPAPHVEIPHDPHPPRSDGGH